MIFNSFRNDRSLIFLILANLAPIFGVLFFEWDMFYVLIYYWLESAVVGIFNVAKMAKVKHKFLVGKIFLILFFTVYFGGFMIGHLLFLFVLNEFFSGRSILDFGKLLSMILEISVYALALFISHGISFFTNYIGRKEYLRSSIDNLIKAPYLRILLMQITIIFGMFAVILTGMNELIIILFVVFKIIIDIRAHKKEHDKLSDESYDDLLDKFDKLKGATGRDKKMFKKIVSK